VDNWSDFNFGRWQINLCLIFECMIATKNYYSNEIFKKEMSTLFESNFQFIALTSELMNDRDFVTLDYEGTSVVAQNFKGVIKVFLNICSHRFNKIQTEQRGNRPLSCSYHGWTFDVNGFPVGLPQKHKFESLGDKREQLCLKEFHVEICGKFVFFRKEVAGIGLREYLGEFYDTLYDLSKWMGDQVYFGSTPHKTNWKLLVENVTECYHCALVHKDSFLARLGIGNANLEDVVLSGNHSSCHFPRTEVKGEKARKKLMAHLDGREFNHNSFYHIHIFPNLFVASAEGVFFYIGHALPISECETDMRIRYFGPNVEMTENKASLQNIINEESVRLGLTVVSEDQGILENIQKTIHLADKPGIVGDDEIRIKAFHSNYERLMS